MHDLINISQTCAFLSSAFASATHSPMYCDVAQPNQRGSATGVVAHQGYHRNHTRRSTGRDKESDRNGRPRKFSTEGQQSINAQREPHHPPHISTRTPRSLLSTPAVWPRERKEGKRQGNTHLGFNVGAFCDGRGHPSTAVAAAIALREAVGERGRELLPNARHLQPFGECVSTPTTVDVSTSLWRLIDQCVAMALQRVAAVGITRPQTATPRASGVPHHPKALQTKKDSNRSKKEEKITKKRRTCQGSSL